MPCRHSGAASAVCACAGWGNGRPSSAGATAATSPVCSKERRLKLTGASRRAGRAGTFSYAPRSGDRLCLFFESSHRLARHYGRTHSHSRGWPSALCGLRAAENACSSELLALVRGARDYRDLTWYGACYGACAARVLPGISAPLLKGAGLSAKLLRYASKSARSAGRGIPENVIIVPGTMAFGLVTKVNRSAIVQAPETCFMPGE